MRIRHVLAGEAARVREIRLTSLKSDPAAFGSTFERDDARPAEWWERMARLSDEGREQRTFVVVDDADRWLGLALVRPDDESPGDAVLNAMWVAPEARGRGAARALCAACVEWAAARGFPRVNLNVKVGNVAALGAYRAVGFVEVGVCGDELVMARRL